MKKLILQSLMIGIVSISFAQKEKMISASQYLKSGDLVSAKDRIDIAVNHEKTKANPKAWFYRGEIYKSISKSKDTAISKLHANPYKEASISYSKSMELDEKGKYLNKNKAGKRSVYISVFNTAVESFNAKDFQRAYNYFVIADDLGIKNKEDIEKNKRFKAQSAVRLNKYDEASKGYKELIMIYPNDISYVEKMVVCLDSMGDYAQIAQELESVVKGAFKDSVYKVAELNSLIASYYIKANIVGKKIDVLEKDDNGDKYLLGLCYLFDYDNVKEVEKKNLMVVNAKKAFTRALELNPEHIDANYWLGFINMSEAQKYMEDADDAFAKGKMDKGDELEKKGKVVLSAALEYYLAQEKVEKDKYKMDKIYNNIIKCYNKLKDYPSAKVYKEKRANM
jgi:hypothetical protein